VGLGCLFSRWQPAGAQFATVPDVGSTVPGDAAASGVLPIMIGFGVPNPVANSGAVRPSRYFVGSRALCPRLSALVKYIK
jgi:hypothetical protein